MEGIRLIGTACCFLLLFSIFGVPSVRASGVPEWIRVGAYANYTAGGEVVVEWKGKYYLLGLTNDMTKDSYMRWEITDISGDVATFHFEIYIHLMDTGGGSPWGGLPPELDSLHYRIEKDVRVNVRDRTLADGSGVVHLWSVIEDDVVWHLDMRSPVDVQNHPKARPFYTSDITNITPKGITVRWDYPLNIPYKGKNFTDVFVMTGATYTNESLSANLEFSRDLSIYVENLYGAWGGWTHMFHAGFSLMQLYDGDSGLMIAGWMDDIVIEELNFVSPLGVALNDTNIFDTQQVFPWEILLLPLAGAVAGVAIWVWWKFRK